MIHMLVRNRVKDFDAWKAVFDSQHDAGLAAGLTVVHLWRELEDPNNIFFVLEVADLEKAQAFISSPEGKDTGERSGVLDGDYHFVEVV